MRARHRHFNPRDAGASVAFDSRYGFSQSDGTAVDTWISRTGSNNATQTGASRPFYETNEQGGQPTIRFNGTNNFLATTLTIGQPCTIFSVIKENQRHIGGIVGSNTNGNVACGDVFQSPIDYNKGAWSSWGYAKAVYGNANALVNQNWNVLVFLFNGATPLTDWSIFSNGLGGLAATQTSGSAPTCNFTNLRIGSATNNQGSPIEFWNGDISYVSAISSATTASLRRRLEHSAAYSFKIACS